jgi:putative hemolysin
VQRAFGFAELNDVVSSAEASGRPDALAALAEALEIDYRFNGLENLKSIGNRPVVLFANHPTGGGNVLGLSILLASQFSDYRILGNQHMKFLGSLSSKMIPVDPFCSSVAINLESLMKLRQEFGTQYQALGVFPAGISSRLQLNGIISDRDWRDAFIRIARHHDALLVPVWFSGRNRLRYYLAARIRAELGFLALPTEFLRLRGTSIEVKIGEPIDPEVLRAIPDRRAQMSFLRAGVYELGRQGAQAVAKTFAPRLPARKIELPHAGAAALGHNLEMRFLDSKTALQIDGIASNARADLADATYHVVVSPRDGAAPYAHWQVLDWRQFSDDELDRISPVRRAFRLPRDADRASRSWQEIVSFGMPGKPRGLTAMRWIGTALRRSATLASASDVVGLVTSQEKHVTRAALTFARLQKTFTDAALLCAGAASQLIGATGHHNWRPLRDVAGLDKPTGPRTVRDGAEPTDSLLVRLANIGFRFGAAGLTAEPTSRPCVLARLNLAA